MIFRKNKIRSVPICVATTCKGALGPCRVWSSWKKVHPSGMLLDPLVTIMLCICEYCGGSRFAEAGSDSQTPWTRAHYENIMDYSSHRS